MICGDWMITINDEKCTGCGACIRICHEHCMILQNNKVTIDYQFCSACSQCVSVCPESALAWNDTPSVPFDSSQLPTSRQLEELFKQRRTNRFFLDKKISRELLEEIAQYGAYAPSHRHDFRMIILDDANLLQTMDETQYRFNRRIYRFMFKSRFINQVMKCMPSAFQEEFYRARPKLEASLRIGRAYASLPPAVLLIVGKKRMPLMLESAQYILYNIDLFARTKGLGCRNLVGNQMFFNRSRQFRKTVGIQKCEQIYGTLGIGYPRYPFRNKVEGRSMKIQWNNASAYETIQQ